MMFKRIKRYIQGQTLNWIMRIATITFLVFGETFLVLIFCPKPALTWVIVRCPVIPSIPLSWCLQVTGWYLHCSLNGTWYQIWDVVLFIHVLSLNSSGSTLACKSFGRRDTDKKDLPAYFLPSGRDSALTPHKGYFLSH